MPKEIKTKSRERVSHPVRTQEAQENLMINLAMKQAEDMLREGRAPSQVVVHFLKLATEKTKFENEKLKADAELSKAKSELVQTQKEADEKYEEVINALKSYGLGSGVLTDDHSTQEYYEQ